MWLERVRQMSCLGARKDHLVLRLAIHLETHHSVEIFLIGFLGRLVVDHQLSHPSQKDPEAGRD